MVVDLPGIYSLSPYTIGGGGHPGFPDLGGKPDGIINIVDATNIERNLYLTLQLMELEHAHGGGAQHDGRGSAPAAAASTSRSSRQELGVPVVPISAAKNEGISRTG